jgi:hypothetical protein
MLRHERMVSAGHCAAAGLLFLLAAGSLHAQERPTARSVKTTLLTLSAAAGIEIVGAEQLGDEPAPSPSLPVSAGMLRRLLEGYSYALEFAPAKGVGAEPPLLRIHIIGRAGQSAPEPLQQARDRTAPALPQPAEKTRPLASPLLANIHPVDPLSGFGPLLRRGDATGGAGTALLGR